MSERIEYDFELPKGWSLLDFSESCFNTSLNGIKIKQKQYLTSGKYPVVDQGQDIIGGYFDDNNLVVPDSPPYIVFGDHTKVKKYINFNFIAGADGVKVLKPYSFFIPKLFYYFIQCIKLPDKGYARHYQFLAKAEIPLPPLSEQNRILSKMEELFSELDKGIESLKKAQKQFELYRQAVLKWAFEGIFSSKWRAKNQKDNANQEFQKIKSERNNLYVEKIEKWTLETEEASVKNYNKPQKPKKPYSGSLISEKEKESFQQIDRNWAIIRFIDLIKYEPDAIKRGPFGSSIKKSFFVPSGYKVYEQQNAINDNASLGKYYINKEKYDELFGFSIKPGDYIISCSGTIGRITKLPNDCHPGIINQALMKIRVDDNLILPKYFLYLFRSEMFQMKILKGTKGTGMQNMAGIDELKETIILLPPKREQEIIIKEIENRLSVCDKIEETIGKSLIQSVSLRQSILKKAFEGKLVPQDPNDEPASVLLEKIRKEKDDIIKTASEHKQTISKRKKV